MNISGKDKHSLAAVQLVFFVSHFTHQTTAQAEHNFIVAVCVLLKVQIFVYLIIKILAFYASVSFINDHNLITVQIYFHYYKTYFFYNQDSFYIMNMG